MRTTCNNQAATCDNLAPPHLPRRPLPPDESFPCNDLCFPRGPSASSDLARLRKCRKTLEGCAFLYRACDKGSPPRYKTSTNCDTGAMGRDMLRSRCHEG